MTVNLLLMIFAIAFLFLEAARSYLDINSRLHFGWLGLALFVLAGLV